MRRLNTPQRQPFATLVIIALNIAAAFAILGDPALVYKLGFVSSNPSFKTAFCSLFMHQNVLHLLGNMVFLAAVGPAVEIAAGSIRFLLVYFLGGFAGVVAHWIFTQGQPHVGPMIGASGCVSSCIAYYAYRYYHLKVNVAPNWAVPIVWIVAIWVALQAAGAFVMIGNAHAGTAYWAHLGGFAMGAILSLAFRAPVQAHREIARKSVATMGARSPAAKLAAADNILRGAPDDAEALIQKAEALAQLNEPDEEADCLVRYLDLVPESQQPDALIRLDKINRLDRIPARRRTMLADRYKTNLPDLSRLLLFSVIRVMTDNERPDALYALAVLDQETDPEAAKSWIAELFARYPLHPASDLARAKGWTP